MMQSRITSKVGNCISIFSESDILLKVDCSKIIAEKKEKIMIADGCLNGCRDNKKRP